MDKQQRLEKANQLIKAIAECGRRFFYNKEHNRTAAIELDPRGRVWLIDDYTGKRIYTHYSHRWRGFSHGGTLKQVVEHLRDFITHGTLLPRTIFGPWPQWYSQGDPWEYGDDMRKVREAAADLGLLSAKRDVKEIA